MSHGNLFVTMFVVCLVAVCATTSRQTGRHEPAKKGNHEESAKAFNPLAMVENMMNPTTRAPSTEMLAISKAASAAVRIVDRVAGTITGFVDRAKSMQSMSRSAAQKVIDGVVARTQAIARKQGGEPGCVTAMMGRAGALAMQVALDETDCPGNKVTSLEDMMETVVKSGQTALELVPKAALALDKCERKGGPFELICRAKIVTDMTARATSVGVRVTEVGAKAANLAATIEPSLASCAGLKVANSAAKAALLVGTLGTCTAKAMRELVG